MKSSLGVVIPLKSALPGSVASRRPIVRSTGTSEARVSIPNRGRYSRTLYGYVGQDISP
jgi:hypothetical protein